MLPPLEIDAFVERFVIEPSGDGPLHGTSFAAKDLFDVAGHHTGCGSPAWRASHPPAVAHAKVIDTLLHAGARLLGKTRTDEMAYALDGRNAHEGAPRNPAAPGRLTGGSSSGSAAAVAAGEVDFALATDTAGSVRVPAAWCGVIGLRTTHGRVSAAGVTPLAPGFDTVGWFACSAILMQRVGAVLLDAACIEAAALQIVHDPVLDACLTAATPPPPFPDWQIRSLGIDLGAAAQCLRTLQAREAWRTHGAWIDAVRPQFGPGVAERFAAARAVGDADVADARALRAELCTRLEKALPTGTLLCLPCVASAAPPRDASPEVLQRQRERLFPLGTLASLTGRPQLVLPWRTYEGLPVGLSLLGWRGGDEALLALAARLCP